MSKGSSILAKMTKKSAPQPLDNLETSSRSDSSSESELEKKPSTGPVKKNGEPKKPFVYTEARKAAFERARKAREEMGNTKKEIIETKRALREVKKEKLNKLKDAVTVEVKKKEKLEKHLAPSSDEESVEMVQKPRKKKAKKVKQVMYYSSDSSSDSSDDGGYRRSKKPVNVVINNAQSEPPKRLPPRTGMFI